MIDDFDRFLIIEMMQDAYQEMDDVNNKLVFAVQHLEGELLNAEDTEDDEYDLDVVEYLDKVKDLEDRKYSCMLQLERAVEALPVELQEYDFKDDIEYKSLHDGLYVFLESFTQYARSIIETCLFFDYDLTMKWANDNGYFDEGE